MAALALEAQRKKKEGLAGLCFHSVSNRAPKSSVHVGLIRLDNSCVATYSVAPCARRVRQLINFLIATPADKPAAAPAQQPVFAPNPNMLRVTPAVRDSRVRSMTISAPVAPKLDDLVAPGPRNFRASLRVTPAAPPRKRLIHCKGKKRIHIREAEVTVASLNKTDVYV